jgi:hypothetical protein
LFWYENDVKYLQLLERLRFEWNHLIDRKSAQEHYRNDIKLITEYMRKR